MYWLTAPHHIESLSFECHPWVATILLVLAFLPFSPKLCDKWNTKLITVQSINDCFFVANEEVMLCLFILMNVWAFWHAFTLGSWKYSIARWVYIVPSELSILIPDYGWVKRLLTLTYQMNVWFFQVLSRRKLWKGYVDLFELIWLFSVGCRLEPYC